MLLGIFSLNLTIFDQQPLIIWTKKAALLKGPIEGLISANEALHTLCV